jgi:hypothetical protein
MLTRWTIRSVVQRIIAIVCWRLRNPSLVQLLGSRIVGWGVQCPRLRLRLLRRRGTLSLSLLLLLRRLCKARSRAGCLLFFLLITVLLRLVSSTTSEQTESPPRLLLLLQFLTIDTPVVAHLLSPIALSLALCGFLTSSGSKADSIE